MELRVSPSAWLAGVALAALAALPQCQAQSIPRSGKIVAIRVAGSQKYPEAQIAAASGLNIGDAAGREEIQGAADRLAQLGPFAYARYRFLSTGQDLTVEFQVEDAPTVPVSFDNFPWFTDAELTDALKQAVTLFDGTAPEQGTILDAMTETLQKLLVARGVRAGVERTLMAAPASDGMMQQFKAVGAGLKVEAVQFGDALAMESKRLQDRLSDVVGKPYSRFALEIFANEQVRPVYLERGHLRVRLGKPEARFTGDPNRPLPSSVLVIIPIEPGPAYRWGGSEWRGNAALSPAELGALLGLKEGDLADGVKIAGGWERVLNEYTRRGYLDAKAVPEPVFDDAAPRVSYGVTVAEGLQYRMGELVITGLSLAAERRLREAWRLPQGEIFDRNYFQQVFAKVERPRPEVFGDLPVHYEQVGQWLRRNPEARTVDVLLDFK